MPTAADVDPKPTTPVVRERLRCDLTLPTVGDRSNAHRWLRRRFEALQRHCRELYPAEEDFVWSVQSRGGTIGSHRLQVRRGSFGMVVTLQWFEARHSYRRDGDDTGLRARFVGHAWSVPIVLERRPSDPHRPMRLLGVALGLPLAIAAARGAWVVARHPGTWLPIDVLGLAIAITLAVVAAILAGFSVWGARDRRAIVETSVPEVGDELRRFAKLADRLRHDEAQRHRAVAGPGLRTPT